jgi:hypothetical protein
MIALRRIFSRTRYVVVKKGKKNQRPLEFFRKVDALGYALAQTKVGIQPECFEVRLTWPEYFKRMLRRPQT